VHYRLYTPSDFAALYAIEEACFEPPFRFSRSYMRHILRDPETATWIAESITQPITDQDSQMAGFAIVEWGEGRKETVAYIQTIEVLPAHRGKGIAAELLRRMESSARAAGAHSIWLHVDAENTSAINLYTSHGFAIEGREENYYPQGRPALILAKPLELVA
jgi:ribosomal protein S18 acetylase RimI-like enzyme